MNNRDSVSMEQPQQNHWLLSNLLPQGKSESTSNSTDGSPVRNISSPNSLMNSLPDGQKMTPQQKPVNLLPEVPTHISFKLNEREQRDCDVIGNIFIIIIFYRLNELTGNLQYSINFKKCN